MAVVIIVCVFIITWYVDVHMLLTYGIFFKKTLQLPYPKEPGINVITNQPGHMMLCNSHIVNGLLPCNLNSIVMIKKNVTLFIVIYPNPILDATKLLYTSDYTSTELTLTYVLRNPLLGAA